VKLPSAELARTPKAMRVVRIMRSSKMYPLIGYAQTTDLDQLAPRS
jgi:hypothetical protein